MNDDPGQITALLHRVRSGDRNAESELLEVTYQRLRQIAAQHLRAERYGHTLQPTALVSELYVRLKDQSIDWQGRTHLFAVAALNVRRILVDYARARNAQRRPPPSRRVDIEKVIATAAESPGEMIALDEALTLLAQYDSRQARIVELRIFSGLSFDDIASELGISDRTVKRDWKMARAWISRLLRGDDEVSAGAASA